MRAPLTAVAALCACAAQGPAPGHGAAPPGADVVEAPLTHYLARYAAGQVTVHADYPAGALPDERLDLDDALALEDARATDAHGAPLEVRRDDDGWVVRGCAAGCAVDYRVALDGPRRGGRGSLEAIFDRRRDGAIHAAPPGRWLARPPRARPGARYGLRVEVEAGSHFVSGLRPLVPDRHEYEGALDELDGAPYSAFGALAVDVLTPPGGRVVVARPRDGLRDDAALLAWAARAVRGVSDYWGRFPVPHAAIIVLNSGERGVYFGAARGNGGAAVQLLVGPDTDRDTFSEDWVLVHELAHLGLPNLPAAQRWWEEGLATYLEIVVRARLGLRTQPQAWGELAARLPRGQLAPGDGGFNRSGSWAHTYWGGALFCFLADVRIRQSTGNARSLADALRAVHDAGGTIETWWTPARLVEAADRGAGAPIFAALWRELAEGEQPDAALPQLLEALGVALDDAGEARFDERAPWADVRRAITAPP